MRLKGEENLEVVFKQKERKTFPTPEINYSILVNIFIRNFNYVNKPSEVICHGSRLIYVTIFERRCEKFTNIWQVEVWQTDKTETKFKFLFFLFTSSF